LLLLLLEAPYSLTAIVTTMVWCEEHYPALSVIIPDKTLLVTTNVMYQVFSPYRDVKKIVRFQIMGDFYAQVNFYSIGILSMLFANFKAVRFMT